MLREDVCGTLDPMRSVDVSGVSHASGGPGEAYYACAPHGDASLAFLMVEGAKIDRASHIVDIINVVHETIEFANTVEMITEWMGDREDTLIIVTADHETRGLTVTNDNGVGNYPDVIWSAAWHTSTPVPVYAIGPNAHLATNVTDNTHINAFAKSTALMPENLVAMQIDASAFETTWTSSSGDVSSVAAMRFRR